MFKRNKTTFKMSKPKVKAKRKLLLEGSNVHEDKSKKIRPSNKFFQENNKGKFSKITSNLKAIKKITKGKQQKVVRQIVKGNNNNAVPSNDRITENRDRSRSRSSQDTEGRLKLFKPIIQTRKMKAKDKLNENETQKELEILNKIDHLTSAEIAAGETVTENEVFHDGVDLLINGSDFEDEGDNTGHQDTQDASSLMPPNGSNDGTQSEPEPDSEVECTGMEPGELSSSEEDDEVPNSRQVASKVVKIMPKKQQIPNVKSTQNKYSHLKNDPEFREFLVEMFSEQKGLKRSVEHDQHHGSSKLKSSER